MQNHKYSPTKRADNGPQSNEGYSAFKPWTARRDVRNKLRKTSYDVQRQLISIYKRIRGRETAIPPLQRSNHIPEYGICYSSHSHRLLWDQLLSWRPLCWVFPDPQPPKRLTLNIKETSAAVMTPQSEHNKVPCAVTLSVRVTAGQPVFSVTDSQRHISSIPFQRRMEPHASVSGYL